MLPNIVLFAGINSANNAFGLWETDGTATGTFELTTSGGNTVPGTPAISGEALYGFLPDPPWSLDLTVFNDQVLFVGRDTNFRYNLWTTNGTGAGTKELTGIAGANASGVLAAASTATNSPDFTVYNGAVLFNGLNNVGAGVHGLWTTNGTAPGTHEVTGINGAATTGVNPIDMTVFNGSVLFNGVDGAGHQGLWVTNGTGAGTKEVTGINGAASTGIDPTDMTVFNGEVLFNGVDNTGAGVSGLWVTNGTAPGTHEITVAGGADPSGLNPTDLTVFGNEVLFNGLDQNGHPQLWETNGTATTELTGIPGANASANASGIAPSDLTVFNGEVLFGGLDTTGHQQLWETNGTVAGTKELYAPAWGLQPTNMEVYNGQVLFSGYDFHGGTPFHSLWTTDGTAIGTHEVATIANTYSIGLFPTDLTALRSTTPPNFFNSDNKADILWQNANGDTELWNSVSGSESFTGEDLGVVGGGWQIAGTGAFNGASEAGILWRNSNGDTGLWNANGSGGFTYQDLGVVSTSWQVAGTGDFNGDGEDILWRNTNGDTELWNANGAGGFSGQDLGVVPTSWQVAGTGDFTGTGADSILWRNSNGDTELWNPNGSGGFTGQDLGVVPASWQVAGTGDFTGTGDHSILWRNSNGDTELWNPNGAGGFTGEDLGVVPSSWQIAGTGDFSGNGQSGIVWRNSNGDTELWNPNGAGGFTGEDLGVVPSSWNVHKIFA